MGRSWAIRVALGLLLLQCVGVAVALPFVNESLAYRAFYQGIFSAQKLIGIADVGWETSRIDAHATAQPAIETQMSVSSEAYPFVETLYPFRLVYRSLTTPGPVRSIAYEKYDSTEQHGRDLTWLDEESGVALRFREGHIPNKKMAGQLPEALESWGSQQQDYQYYARARHKSLPGMVDQVSLLQRIREAALSVDARFKVPVTDGKHRYVYKVRVVSAEPLVVANREWKSLKVRFDGYRVEDGKKIRDHNPLWVWLDNTPRRTPLRFEYSNTFGRFVINLQSIDT
jgi:hypothetical protein